MTPGAIVGNILAGAGGISHPRDAAAYQAMQSNEKEQTGTADVKDVRVRKFVVSDDKGNNFNADVTSGSNSTGTMTFSGETQTGRTNVIGWNPRSFATINTYERFTAEHKYYFASYEVTIPLFNSQGKALITPDVKELTLHIITDNGEQQVKYQLAARKR